jgi:hypothetical protein
MPAAHRDIFPMKNDPLQINAILAVRLLALVFGTVGLWQGASNLIETAGDFDPTYTWHYFLDELLRPAAAIALGAGLAGVSCWLGRLLARGLDKS